MRFRNLLGATSIVAFLTLTSVLTMGASGGAVVFIVILCMIVAVVGFAVDRSRRSFQIVAATSLSPAEAIRTAVQTYTMNSWEITSQTYDNATFALRMKGSCLVAGFLLLCGFIPGILYLAYSGRTINVNVFAKAEGTANTTVTIAGTSAGYGGRKVADRFVLNLPPAGNAMPLAASD